MQYPLNTQNIKVIVHDKRRFQPGASIHLEMGGGQSASEKSRAIGALGGRGVHRVVLDLWRGCKRALPLA